MKTPQAISESREAGAELHTSVHATRETHEVAPDAGWPERGLAPEQADDSRDGPVRAEAPSPIDGARAQTVIERERIVVPSRVITETAPPQQESSQRDTPVRSEPRVHIGVVEVVIAAPAAETRAPAAGARPTSSNIASRRYLRSL
jgi:hypothetical protein